MSNTNILEVYEGMTDSGKILIQMLYPNFPDTLPSKKHFLEDYIIDYDENLFDPGQIASTGSAIGLEVNVYNSGQNIEEFKTAKVFFDKLSYYLTNRERLESLGMPKTLNLILMNFKTYQDYLRSIEYYEKINIYFYNDRLFQTITILNGE